MSMGQGNTSDLEAPSQHPLADGTTLLIRPAEVADAAALLDYFETVSGESDFLTFGPRIRHLAEEEAVLKKVATRDNELYVVGAVDGRIVGVLTFSAGERPRLRHVGEFGLSILKSCWGLGVGRCCSIGCSNGARRGQVINKINLRVSPTTSARSACTNGGFSAKNDLQGLHRRHLLQLRPHGAGL